MEEEIDANELKEKLEQAQEFEVGWSKYLALTTAIIAVLAAVASLQSGNYANGALLEKNEAILFQNKASDQWNYYQAKGIKKNMAESFYEQTHEERLKGEAERYAGEQNEIKAKADEYEKRVDESNKKSEKLLEKHHKVALGITFFQVAIALSAMSALLKRKSLWVLSLLLSVGGLVFFVVGLVS